jgi:multiple sugar transport system permease protein
LVAAMLLQEVGRWGKVLRTLFLFPWTLSQAVAATLWLWLLNPSYGVAPYMLRQVGIDPGLMLGDPSLALFVVICVTAWWSFPYPMVLVSAALQSVPAELYEAVAIDGGGPLITFRHVTWPHVSPTLASAALALGILYLTLITLFIVLTGGGPLGATTTWSYEIFRRSFQSIDLGVASVLSIIILAVNVGIGVTYVRVTKRLTA